jgi:hypothetical protein
MVHENVPHYLCGDAKEVSAALPLRRFVPNQTEIRLVNQRPALKGVVGPFAAEIMAGDTTQLTVDKGNQLFPRVRITLPPLEEKLSDSLGRCGTTMHL